MTVTPIIFFDMAVTIFILGIALVCVVFLRLRSDGAFQESEKLLSEARKKAVKMINDANGRAIDIINKANLSADIASNTFNQQISHIASMQIKEFEKDSSNFIKLHHQMLLDLKSKNIELFHSLSKDIETNTVGEINNFKVSMENLTSESQNLVRKKINADYEAAKKEIENYKNEEFRKIEDQIYALLEKVSNLALGKTISLSDHEDLILKSLEKAKKEGTFSV